MPRLDLDRQNELEPKRMAFAKEKLAKLGITFTFEGDKEIRFMYKGSQVSFWPYSGWHSGKTIIDGRGLENLLRQIKTA